MLDEVITGGTVVDGTGAAPQRADVGIRDGRVVALGALDEPAVVTTDATGLLVTPGFVDPHTHYDAQLLWDPAATPSSAHGVTTVIGGNCGFTLAPVRPGDEDYLRRMMAKVEGMPLAALETGVEWGWESFADYLDRLDGRMAVNAGFLVGHCAVRRYVMGPDAVGQEATPGQVEAMTAELRRAIEAGGLGLSTTRSSSHSDGDGQPVASRWATEDELLALCAEVGRHAGRPLNWNVLTVEAQHPEKVERQLSAADRAEAAGGRVVALTMPVAVPMNMSFRTFCGLWLLPGWKDVLERPEPERLDRLRDPAVRAHLAERARAPEAGVLRVLAHWDRYVIGDTYAAVNAGLGGRVVGDIAAERGIDPFDALLDIVVADDLRTILWPVQPEDEHSWALRKRVWDDPRAMLGGSDAGAHLDRMCGAPYPTRFLGDALRGHRLVPVERAVQMLTQAPAELFGLIGRGTLTAGSWADVVVLDPGTVGSGPATLVADLPGGSARLTAGSVGVRRVLVNGTAVVVDGEATGEVPGRLLRSGRDTLTVTTGTTGTKVP
jgi:N-acyl-D-aspartate/D-glutamate deacylase